MLSEGQILSYVRCPASLTVGEVHRPLVYSLLLVSLGSSRTLNTLEPATKRLCHCRHRSLQIDVLTLALSARD